MYFEDLIQNLTSFWKKQGCTILPSYNDIIGAGTLSPYTAIDVMKRSKWKVCYLQPSVRQGDSRGGGNKNRLYKHHQFQVIIKPVEKNIKDVYLESLYFLGIEKDENEIKFLEDDWQNPSIGAKGVGWEVWLNGIEVSQFTYMQQIGGIMLDTPAIEFTYGLERLILFLQNKDSIYDVEWNKNFTYGDIFLQNEIEQLSALELNLNAEILIKHFEDYENIHARLIEKELPIPAYEYCLKAINIINILDAMQKISHQERANYILKTRAMTKKCSELII